MQPLTIAVLAGTTRPKRESIKAARYIADYARTRSSDQQPLYIVLVDPADFNFPGDGNDPEGKDPRYTAIVDKADAFFIVTPEYNHSFPGSLKRMLDSELALYNHKPVAFAGASSGRFGGVRAVEALVGAVRETGLVPLSWDIYFPSVQDIFDENGSIKTDLKQRYDTSLNKIFDELIWMAKLLKTGREEPGRAV